MIIAVNGVISGGLSDQTTAGIVFVDNRTDVEKVYINSSTSAGTTLYLMASINAATQSGTFSPRNTIPAGTTSFAIGIKDASTPGGKLATYHDFTVDGDGQLVDGDGKPAITEPTVVAAEVSVTANQAGSFTYTVNGGATQNGTYGTALTGINVGDVVVVTPGIVSGYTVTQSNSSFTANADATKNTDVVEYWAVQESIQVNYQDYFGNTIKPSTTTTGSYGDAALNLTTDGSAVDGYTFNADDAINDPAKAVSFILDANGNVVATDATGATITAITLYYKTNITVNVSGTKVYDGLDSANEVNDYKNLTFTDANGEIIPVDVSGMATGNFYYNADVGVYTDGINLNPNLLTTKNPGYQISGVTSKGYTVTAAKTTATISKDGSKTYDGTAISYLPDVTFSDISGAMVAPDIAWTVADFEYVDAAGNVFTAPTNAGSYTIQFTTAGQARLDAETNYQITVALGSYEIKKAAITVTAKDTSKLLGDADPTLTATSAELVDGDQLTYSISRVIGESAGTYTITATAAATDNPNYAITFKTGTFTIQGATASVTISSGHKTYDGKNIDFLPSVNIVRTDNGTTLPKIDWVADDFEYVLNDEVTTDTKNVDTYTIRLSVNGQAELAALTDYIFATTQPGEYTIDQAAVTITVTPNQSKVFNTADPTSYASTVSATVDNETLAYEVTREAGENVDDYAYIVKLDNSDINKNYAITVINSLFKITPAAGEVTLNGGFKDYDGQPVPTLTIESPVVVNLVQGDDYTITPEPGTATATLKDAGTYTYTLTQAGIDKIDLVNRNYTLNNYSKSATYTINKKAVTLTANNTGKNFGITKDPTLSATARAGDVVAGETLDYTISRVAGEKVGTYTITATATAGKNSNYDITTKTGTFTISPAPLSEYQINAGSKVYDSSAINAVPKVYGTLADGSSLELSQNANLVSADFIYTPTTGTDDLTGVGLYTVSLTTNGFEKLMSANTDYYLSGIAGATGTYEITPADATIKINYSSKVYDGKAINYVPTVSLTDSAAEITVPKDVQLSDGDYTITSVSGSADLEDAGDYQIVLTAQGVTNVKAAFSNFNLGTSTDTLGEYTITKQPATITLDSKSMAYDGQPHTPTATVSGEVNGEKLQYTLSAGLTYPGTKTVTATFDPKTEINKNYNITVKDNALTITGDAFITINRVIHYVGAGFTSADDVTQTLSYGVVDTGIVDGNGNEQLRYTLSNASPNADIPLVTGYTPSSLTATIELNADKTAYLSIDGSGAPVTQTEKPTAADITITYTANEEPVTVNATGNDVENGATTFTYTVNGGDKLTGTYGTSLTGIHYGDTVAITPGTQDGYDSNVDHSTIVVSEDGANNAANVTYVADYRQIEVQVIESTTEKVIGSITLHGKTGETYAIAEPPASLNLDYMEGMNNGTLEHTINSVPLLTLTSTDGSLTGTYAADQADNATVKIYYTMNDQTLNVDYVKLNADGSYQNIGAGTVSYSTATGKITWDGQPAGYEATPVDSVIHYLDSGKYVSLGSNSAGIYTVNDLNVNVDEGDAAIAMMLDNVFNPSFVLTPQAQTVIVNAVANKADNKTFTYTVNGGAKLTGTYGTPLEDIVTADVIAVTPNVQAGYAFKQSAEKYAVNAVDDVNAQVADTVTYSTISIGAADITYGAAPTYTLDIQTDSGVKTIKLTAADIDITDPVYTNSGQYLAAGSYDLTLNTTGLALLQAENPDFTFGAITGKLVVAKKEITVTAGSDTKIYAATDPVLTSKVNKNDLVGKDELAYTVSRATGENVGSYVERIQSGQNDNYTIKPVDGEFTITPLATTPDDQTTQVTTGKQEITFGQKTPTFGVTVSADSKLNLDGVTLTNADFDFYTADGKTKLDEIPTDQGTYKVNLNAAGQKLVQDANPNYTLSADDFIAGIYTIDPLATTPDDQTTEVTTGKQEIIFGQKTPVFDVTVSADSKLNLDGVTLTNADFDFYTADGKTKLDEVPTDQGTYKVNLNAAGQKLVQDANPNYTLSADDFIAGTYTITPKETVAKDPTTQVTTGKQEITFGQETPAFGVTVSADSKLNLADLDLTNDNFTFVNKVTGKAVDGIPTDQGTYTVSLNTTGQGKV